MKREWWGESTSRRKKGQQGREREIEMKTIWISDWSQQTDNIPTTWPHKQFVETIYLIFVKRSNKQFLLCCALINREFPTEIACKRFCLWDIENADHQNCIVCTFDYSTVSLTRYASEQVSGTHAIDISVTWMCKQFTGNYHELLMHLQSIHYFNGPTNIHINYDAVMHLISNSDSNRILLSHWFSSTLLCVTYAHSAS